jgi:2-C-methyl-D-erythritol 4-phosphate cytidylyltransferase
MVQVYGCAKVRRIVAGGAKRQDSVGHGLAQLNDDVTIVSVHDGARPCVTADLISETIVSAKRYGSGVAAAKITDTVKWVENGVTVTKTMDRAKLWAVQTPQTFRVDLLRKAFAQVAKKRATVTDEAAAVELLGEKVRLVPVTQANIKITTPDDLALANLLLRL